MNYRRAFTLIELLIVLVILGILAAIIVPKFSNAADGSRHSAAVAQLRHIRTAISVYRSDHGGRLPDIRTNWNDLTTTSVHAGKTVGPYLKSLPKNPNNQLSSVEAGNVKKDLPSGTAGFIYDFNNGAGTGHIVATDTDGQTLFNENQ